jgi:hypothetical protein
VPSMYGLETIAENALTGLVLDQYLEQPMAGYMVAGYAHVSVPRDQLTRGVVAEFLREHEDEFRDLDLFVRLSRDDDRPDMVSIDLEANYLFIADAMIIAGARGIQVIWDVLKEEEIPL